MSFQVPERFRITGGAMGSTEAIGNNGCFLIKSLKLKNPLFCIASDGMGWEHVSVSLNKNRCPTWDEMVIVKSLFWSDDDCVMQFHPAKDQYINNHPFCLHLWKPIDKVLITPPSILVGVQS